MQTDYLFHGVKGYKNIDRFSYIFSMNNKEAQTRLKILNFYDKYGLNATIEAFDISKRTIYRWKAKLKENGNSPEALNPKSTKPKNFRKSSVHKDIVCEIKRLREVYPNIGKAKLHVLLQQWCKDNNHTLPSQSTIGRVIANDKDKMRITPLRIDRNGKVKPKRKRVFKNRKPKNLKTNPIELWAVDTIQKVSNGIRRYIMTFIDPNTRIAYAVALPSKHTVNTALALSVLLDGIGDLYGKSKFMFLTDNGSEFKKDFDALLQQKSLTHYWTYPRSPKMNAHNERFNRTIQEQFVDFYEDLLFTDMELFNELMADWLIKYNTQIPHHSLLMKTPVQYLLENRPECQMWWTNTCSCEHFLFML